jgi:hypothetical protein
MRLRFASSWRAGNADTEQQAVDAIVRRCSASEQKPVEHGGIQS